MLQALFLIILLEPLLVSGTFTCMGSDWVLDGSKCLKLIAGSPKDGQAQCSIEDSSAKLVLPPNSQEAANVAAKFPGKTIWVGLRFQNGEAWIWNDGSTGSIEWGSSPLLPQLCTGVIGDYGSHLNFGDMYDRFCHEKDGLICQTETDVLGSCEPDWTQIGSLCYKRLLASDSGVTYIVARILCTNENAKVMMPQSKNEAKLIATTLNCGVYCWVGLADFDADHTYTWEDGTNESQSNLYFGNNQPSHRDLDYVCAYIQDDQLFNRECTRLENIICEKAAIYNLSTTDTVQLPIETEGTSAAITTTMQISAIKINTSIVATEQTALDLTSASDNPSTAAPTTVSTTKEPISSVESETEVTSEHLSTALNVSSHISSVLSTTSTEQPQGPTQTTTFTDDATAKTTHTQTNRIRPTTSSSPKGKSNCSQSSTNSCRCQKRTVANTTENQEMQTLKVTDYIWLNKCTLQPMIDSGMIKVSNCPYVCKCSPKGSSTNVQEDMFACVRRP